jgi:hypothetical protein
MKGGEGRGENERSNILLLVRQDAEFRQRSSEETAR